MAGLSFSQPLAAASGVCALVGMGFIAAAFWMRRRGYGRHQLSRGRAACVALPAVGVLSAAAWFFGLHEADPLSNVPIDPEWSRLYAQAQLTAVPQSGGFVLAPGDELPALKGLGWINGDSPGMTPLLGKVVVVDIWNEL